MTSDEFEVDATPCKTVQRPVFRAAIDTPEPRAAEVCEPGRVRHDLLVFNDNYF